MVPRNQYSKSLCSSSLTCLHILSVNFLKWWLLNTGFSIRSYYFFSNSLRKRTFQKQQIQFLLTFFKYFCPMFVNHETILSQDFFLYYFISMENIIKISKNLLYYSCSLHFALYQKSFYTSDVKLHIIHIRIFRVVWDVY